MKRLFQAFVALALLAVTGWIVWNDWLRPRFELVPAPMAPPMVPPLAREEREIVGIGAVLKGDDAFDGPLVVEVLPNSPAAKAGIQAGAHIQKIDDTPTAGLALADCVRRIRGPVGSKLRLEWVDEALNATNTIELVRAKVEIPQRL